MVSDWSVRDEILRVTHNWPIPVFAFIIGCLIGWGLSYILPPSYQAEVTLFVAYDDVRECRNPDDCKNWQLEQTDAFAKSQIVLDPALSQLQAIDPIWHDVSIEEFAAMLDVLWRNTGRWRMVAESKSAEISQTAVEVWSQVYLNEYESAQKHSLKVIDLNPRLRALNQNKVQLERKLLILDLVKKETGEYHNLLAVQNQHEQITDLTRWELYNLAAQASDLNLAWLDLLDSFPGELAPQSNYLIWLDQLAVSLDQEIEFTSIQLEQLDLETKNTVDQIGVESELSHGLSTTIEVSRMVDVEAQVIESRRTTTAAVLGGIVGLLVWGLVWIAFPIWRSMK